MSNETVGNYRGEIAPVYRDPGFMAWLSDMGSRVHGDAASVISRGRNLNVRVDAPCGGRALPLMVKAFGRQSRLKDRLDRRRGTKAARTWQAARVLDERGVGTPRPVGFLERWSGSVLSESYYLCEFVAGVTNLRDELIRLFREDPECERFMTLLQTVADAVRAMHEAGFQHNDLGNQNIMLQPAAGCPREVLFVDLNRGRLRASLSDRRRARDLSRIYLPSDFLRVFKEMYDPERSQCRKFQKWERFYRRRYAWHSLTRPLRHPLRALRRRRGGHAGPQYPSAGDMWVWDERSGQAIGVLRSRDRWRFYPRTQGVRIASAVLSGLVPVRAHYRQLRDEAYGEPVALSGRVGVALCPAGARCGRELPLLDGLGADVPVLLRFYAHEGPPRWAALADTGRRLHDAGRGVTVALVQDRASVKDMSRWETFVGTVLGHVAPFAARIEIGHAINRVKWGLWGVDDYARMLRVVADVSRAQPAARFMGPAVIDFEYPFLMAALRRLPDGCSLDALSHHLYVDRRGAPENRQGRFGALEKFALARAIARWAPGCADRLIVSEVNWPLRGTGVYSPVGSPYESPGPRRKDPSVDEEVYADYMLRYILTALCSGLVEQVFWWRLAAHGYGLVDDRAEPWRERPAYRALARFIALLGDATFRERLPCCADTHLLAFTAGDGREICAAYTHGPARDVRLPVTAAHVEDAMGEPVPCRRDGSGSMVALGGRPVYVFAG